MLHKRRRSRLRLPDLFTPLPQRPTWDSLPPTLTQRVIELLAELLRAPAAADLPQAPPKEDNHE